MLPSPECSGGGFLCFFQRRIDDLSLHEFTAATRFNSWNYPLVTSTLQPELFKSAMAARAHAKREFGAEPGQFASK